MTWGRVGRTAWIWMLLAIVVVIVLLTIAWVDGGAQPLRSIEQPVPVRDRGE